MPDLILFYSFHRNYHKNTFFIRFRIKFTLRFHTIWSTVINGSLFSYYNKKNNTGTINSALVNLYINA